jgi:hypothetical protein
MPLKKKCYWFLGYESRHWEIAIIRSLSGDIFNNVNDIAQLQTCLGLLIGHPQVGLQTARGGGSKQYLRFVYYGEIRRTEV